MTRFLLTSEKFTGSAEVWFDDNGSLARVDLITANMDFRQVAYLLKNTSPEISTFKGMLTGSGLVISEVPLVITVDDFIKEYPYKRNTHLVKEYWPKMAAKEQERAFFAAMEYRDYCQRNGWYKPRIPETWLKKKEYLNNWKTM